MNIRNKNAKAFISKVDREAQRLSVNLLFGSGKSIISGIGRERDSGHFMPPDEDSAGYIAIATGLQSAEWLHTLAHEYCHMLQWFRDHPLYVEFQKKGGDLCYYNLEEYTERQACRLIEKYELPCGNHMDRATKYLQDLRNSLSLKTS